MPRKTYDPKSGRRRPAGPSNDFRALEHRTERPRPAPSLPPHAAAHFQHRPECRGSSLTAFQGSRGDLMARCHSCNALQAVTPEEETR